MKRMTPSRLDAQEESPEVQKGLTWAQALTPVCGMMGTLAE